MAEGLAIDDAFLGIIVIGHAIEHPQESGVLRRRRLRTAGRLRQRGGAAHTVRAVGMGRGPSGHGIGITPGGPRGEVARRGQRGEHVGRGVGVIAGGGHVADAQTIGLIFLIAAIFQRVELRTGADQLGRQIAAGQQPRARRQDRADGGAGVAALRMARGDMADFMPQHRGKLRLRIHQREQLSGDIDIAAGNGEGVLHRRVERRHGEIALCVGQARLDRHALADALDKGRLRAGIAAAILRHELRIGLRALRLVGGRDRPRLLRDGRGGDGRDERKHGGGSDETHR